MPPSLISSFRIKRFAFGLFLATQIAIPLSAQAVYDEQRPFFDHIQTWKTPRGVSVFFIPIHQHPILDLQISFDAGSSRDQKHFGLASLTARLLMTGTKQHDQAYIEDQFDRLGARYNVSVDRDKVTLKLRSLSRSWQRLQRGTQLLSEVITQANFPQNAFLRERQRQKMLIEYSQQFPSFVAKQAAYRAIYANHPYGHLIEGTANSVSHITRKEVLSFYRQHYLVNHATITLVGDISLPEAKTLAKQLLAKLPSGEVLTLPLALPTQHSLPQIIRFPSQQTHILLGRLGCVPQAKDYFPMLVANHILAGQPFTSRLFRKIRIQHGLAYHVGGIWQPLRYHGLWLIQLQSRHTQAVHALSLLYQITQQFIDHGPSQSELALAQHSIIHRFAIHFASNIEIANRVTSLGFYHYPLNFLSTYRQKIAEITLQQIRKALYSYKNQALWNTILVGPIAIKPLTPTLKPMTSP